MPELNVSVTDLARHIAGYVMESRRRPIVVHKRGVPTVVIVSAEEYGRALEVENALDDLYWTAVALKADAEWRAAGRPTVSFEEVVRRAGS